MTKEQKVQEIITRLSKVWPEPKVELDFDNAWQLLVATILAAQCTDKLVNTVTPGLFKKYPTIPDMAAAPIEEVDQAIAKINLHKNKSKFLVNSAIMIMEDFDGEVPQTMAELVKLPGVARKTANVVLGEAFGKQEGIIVDTHVKRVSFQLGLTTETNPVKIEKDLMAIVPQDQWLRFAHLLTLYGRHLCPARKNCQECEPLGDLCISQ